VAELDRLAVRWERRASVHAVELDGEAVVYDSPSGRLHVLNPSATLVWKCLDGAVTGAELAIELSEAFEVDREAMERQIADVLTTLVAEDLIVRAPDH